jgi:hypothetical protein
MAGTVTVTEETFGTVKKIKFEWTSAADGTATGTTTHVYSGEVRRWVTVPGADAAQPTDQYDVAINDEDGADILMGFGANRSNVNAEQIIVTTPVVIANDKLTLSVTNAGNTKGGIISLYVR